MISILLLGGQIAWAQPPKDLAHSPMPGSDQPRDAMGLHQRALSYFNQNDHDNALDDLNSAIELNPYYTQAYFLRGQIFAKRNAVAAAIDDFDKAIAQDDSFAGAYHQRGLAHQERRDYRQALIDLDQAVAREPKNVAMLRDRAIAQRDAGNYDLAVEDYQEALRLGLSAVDPHPLADLLFFQGRFLHSAQTLQQVVRAKPDNRHAALWRYLALVKANDERGAARELAEQSARAAGDKRWPAAVWEYYLGKLDERSLFAAIEQTEEPVKALQQCQAYFYVAEAKLLKGANADAIDHLRAAKSQCPPHTPFFHGANAELKRFGQ